MINKMDQIQLIEPKTLSQNSIIIASVGGYYIDAIDGSISLHIIIYVIPT